MLIRARADMTEPARTEPASAVPPSPEALAADLAAMLRTGVTVERCRSAAALLALELVKAKAARPPWTTSRSAPPT